MGPFAKSTTKATDQDPKIEEQIAKDKPESTLPVYDIEPDPSDNR